MAKRKSVFDRVPKRAIDVVQLNAQALAFLQQGQLQAGIELCRQSLVQERRQPEVRYNLGYALQQLGLLDSAVQEFTRAIELAPNDFEILTARGYALFKLNRFEEALQDFHKTSRLHPQDPDAFNNFGSSLLELGREAEAIIAYEKALVLRPNFSQALFNMGKALAALERHVDAVVAYKAALKFNPNYEEAKWHLACELLVLGELKEGWLHFESRWSVAELENIRRYPHLPQWLGKESISDKSLLLYNEQGLGDTLQFCRYIPMLQAQGAKVSLAVQAPLVTLLADQWPGVTVAESFSDLSGFDMATPLMSLPLALGTTLQTIPVDEPYIHVAESNAPVPSEQPRIGVVWSGSTQHKNDKNRSMPVAMLAPLFDLSLDWICLQPDLREADLAWLAMHPEVRLERPVLNDFVETANLIASLDLIITVDTSVAHLAGAMGKPVWILLPTGCDYRWLLEREDSPWYPSARLFRQNVRGDWPSVIGQVRHALMGFLHRLSNRETKQY